MRAFIYIFIALISLSSTVRASDRAAEERSNNLIGLKILAVDMFGTDHHDRLPRIELMLRRNGIALTSMSKLFNEEYDGTRGILRVLIVEPPPYEKPSDRSSVKIYLNREVVITGATKYGRPLKTYLTVWSDEKSRLSGTKSVDIEIDKIITKFCNDYLRANSLAH